MEAEKSKKKILISGILFPAIAGIMLYLVFRAYDVRRVWRDAAGADGRYLLAGAAAMCGFVVCEAVNIARLLRASGYRVGVGQMLTYGAAGFFFSGITPTASGGQPMQLVYMARDGIRLSHGSLALLLELMSFQLANISLALFGVACHLQTIAAMEPAVKTIIVVGISANAAVFCVLLLLVWNRCVSALAGKLIARVCRALKKESAAEKVAEQLQEYRAGAVYIGEHPGIMLKNLATSFVQMTAEYSITYFVYRALGGVSFGWLTVFSLQAVLTAAIAVIPLPGGVGAGESGFKLMFASVFTGGLLMPGMLLSRGISFYLGLLITGGFLLVVFLCGKAREYRR